MYRSPALFLSFTCIVTCKAGADNIIFKTSTNTSEGQTCLLLSNQLTSSPFLNMQGHLLACEGTATSHLLPYLSFTEPLTLSTGPSLTQTGLLLKNFILRDTDTDTFHEIVLLGSADKHVKMLTCVVSCLIYSSQKDLVKL